MKKSLSFNNFKIYLLIPRINIKSNYFQLNLDTDIMYWFLPTRKGFKSRKGFKLSVLGFGIEVELNIK